MRRLVQIAVAASTVLVADVLQAADPKLSVVQLTGVLEMNDNARACLLDPVSGYSTWLDEGQTFGEIELIEVRATAAEALVAFQGGKRTLKLKESKIRILRNGPLKFERNSDADISFDATQIMIFERAQEIARKRHRS